MKYTEKIGDSYITIEEKDVRFPNFNGFCGLIKYVIGMMIGGVAMFFGFIGIVFLLLKILDVIVYIFGLT